MEKRLVSKTLLYENAIIHDCFEGLSVHNILNQLYTRTRLEIALGEKINKLSFSLPKIQRWTGIKSSLPTPQHNTPLSNFVWLIKYVIISGLETPQERVLMLSIFLLLRTSLISRKNLNFILIENWLWTETLSLSLSW